MQIGQQLAEVRIKQITAGLSTMASVQSVDGTNVTLNMPDGTTRTVTNVSGRAIKQGDAMVTDGKLVGF